MKSGITIVLLSLICSLPSFAKDVVVWERNYNRPFFKETIMNISSLTEEEFGKINFVPSRKMEQGRAFSELLKGNIDIFIAAADIKREQLAKVIYVPIDRGLLGFRLCLVNQEKKLADTIRSPIEFIENDLSVGLGSKWPDRLVYEENNFSVVTSPVYESLFAMLAQQRFDCFSRSVKEVDDELIEYADSNIALDKSIVFIYPNSDFIYISPNNPRLHRQFSVGIGKAIENYSFYDIFEKYYERSLIEHGIYQRQLLILQNTNISPNALSAINRFGIASFATNPISRQSGN